jgi:Reverse transcriptase (RNA-dependent DNA polymerase)
MDVLLPFITHMVNASLLQSRLPDSQKHAIVTPLLEKPALDTADIKNYCPVSNLSFMSKLTERVMAKQLHECLSANNLIPRFQSASRKGHSTETTLLRVSSDTLMAADDRTVTVLSLLGMSTAFDCVDHLILLQHLQVAVGMAGTALDWIRSFLSGRTQQVIYSGEPSVTSAVLFGVPQGTVYSNRCCTSSTRLHVQRFRKTSDR